MERWQKVRREGNSEGGLRRLSRLSFQSNWVSGGWGASKRDWIEEGKLITGSPVCTRAHRRAQASLPVRPTARESNDSRQTPRRTPGRACTPTELRAHASL